jgi:glycosyltransferase involved in cell wall biosynthesis
MKKRNILLVAPPFIPVSKDSVAGIEQAVYSLGRALTEQGHDVYTVARDDSQVYGNLVVGGYKDMYIKSGAELEHFHQAMAHTASSVRNSIRGRNLDVIIDRCEGVSLPVSIEENGPSIILGLDLESKYHIHPSIFRGLRKCLLERKDCFAAASNHTAKEYVQNLLGGDLKSRMRVIPNGVITDNYPLETAKEDYLLYVGRVREGKAPHLAIRAARETGHRIIVVGGNSLGESDGQYEDRAYFDSEIKPFLDSSVKLVGPVGLEEKVKLMQGAKALIFPSQHTESQGLVLLEAMACGTPIIAFRQSKGPEELIVDSKTGFLVRDFRGLKDAISRVSEITPEDCARHVRNNFDYSITGERYNKLIDSILENGSR